MVWLVLQGLDMLPHPDNVMNNLSRIAKCQRIPINGGVGVRIGLRALSSCIWVDFNLKSSNFHKKGFLNKSIPIVVEPYQCSTRRPRLDGVIRADTSGRQSGL